MLNKHYLFLSGYKALSDLKAEAARGYLGVLWWLIEPILYMSAFYFAFGVIFSRGGEGDYVSFLLCGLIVWKWFAGAVAVGSSSIVANMGIMRLVYVPKYVFPLSTVLSGTAKFIVVFVLLTGYLMIMGYAPNEAWLWLPPLLAVQFFLVLGIASALSSLVPFFPDLRALIENALMLLFFLSGVFFDIRQIGGENAKLMFLNPMAGLIDGYRNVLLEGYFDPSSIWYPASFAIASLSLALFLLNKFDRQYPKVIR